MSVFDSFEKKHDFLICVDSDGCVMDTMDIKHIRAFGPCMVDEWQLAPWRDAILERWNQINLYTMTRGINRFKGLAMALTEIDQTYTPIDGIREFAQWVKTAPALSNTAVEDRISAGAPEIFTRALRWSRTVNETIENLPPEELNPFVGAAQGLAAAHSVADVAVVSSANPGALETEWNRFGLIPYIDLLLAQDAGTKSHCIHELLKKGYDPRHVLMVGDSPSDYDSAAENGVWFYPILVRHEAESWAELTETALNTLLSGDFSDYAQEKLRSFHRNLGQD